MGIILSSYIVPRHSKYMRPGIDPICGWDWLEDHEHDLDGWSPAIEYSGPGSHFKMTIKDQKQVKEVSKIMRER